ncbi:MAG: dihydrofolate reductase family protein [bacterium]|nr:dihydrofolate reductase family protein [bacterium]
MRSIIYHVAISIDGYIAGIGDTPAETIQDFVPDGPHVDEYNRQLLEYETVLMGRHTYEFGYAFGMEPGQVPYAHMQNYVFSNHMPEPEQHDSRFHLVRSENTSGDDGLDRVRELRETAGTDIYLCGGGAFARSLLEAGLIDRIKLKINPIILGGGVGLFSEAGIGPDIRGRRLNLEATKDYGNGVLLHTYAVVQDL